MFFTVLTLRGFNKAFAICAMLFYNIVSATVATIPTATWIVVYIVTLAIFLPIVIKASAHGFRTETTCFGAFFKHALLCFWIFAFSQVQPENVCALQAEGKCLPCSAARGRMMTVEISFPLGNQQEVMLNESMNTPTESPGLVCFI